MTNRRSCFHHVTSHSGNSFERSFGNAPALLTHRLRVAVGRWRCRNHRPCYRSSYHYFKCYLNATYGLMGDEAIACVCLGGWGGEEEEEGEGGRGDAEVVGGEGGRGSRDLNRCLIRSNDQVIISYANRRCTWRHHPAACIRFGFVWPNFTVYFKFYFKFYFNVYLKDLPGEICSKHLPNIYQTSTKRLPKMADGM